MDHNLMKRRVVYIRKLKIDLDSLFITQDVEEVHPILREQNNQLEIEEKDLGKEGIDQLKDDSEKNDLPSNKEEIPPQSNHFDCEEEVDNLFSNKKNKRDSGQSEENNKRVKAESIEIEERNNSKAERSNKMRETLIIKMAIFKSKSKLQKKSNDLEKFLKREISSLVFIDKLDFIFEKIYSILENLAKDFNNQTDLEDFFEKARLLFKNSFSIPNENRMGAVFIFDSLLFSNFENFLKEFYFFCFVDSNSITEYDNRIKYF